MVSLPNPHVWQKNEGWKEKFGVKIQGFPAFIGRVVNQLKVNLKRIHNLGVRKIAASALQPLGCLPQSTAQFSFEQCNENQNALVGLHNQLLAQAVNDLNKETNSSSFFLLDIYNAFWNVFNEKQAHQGDSHNPVLLFFFFFTCTTPLNMKYLGLFFLQRVQHLWIHLSHVVLEWVLHFHVEV